MAEEYTPPDVEPGEEEVVEDFIYRDDAPNLVPVFLEHPDGEEVVRAIAERVDTDFNADWDASEEYREQRAGDWKLFSGELVPKEFPFEGCANGNIPIMIENITRLQSRVFAEIFSSRAGVFSVVPVGPDDEMAAELLSHHGNWQIREKIPDFFRQQMRGLLMFYLNGDVTCHSTWDNFKQENRHEMLTCDEFVAPYTFVSTMPDYSDVPHLTRIRYMQPHEIEAMRGTWHDIDIVLARDADFEDSPDAPLAQSIRQVDQVELPSNSTAAPYKLLEYEGHLDLPNQTRQRYCRVIYDTHSQHVLLLEIREEASWEERIRYEREEAELQTYRGSVDQYEVGLEAYRAAEFALANNAELLPEQKAAAQAEIDSSPIPPAPVAPAWMENGEDMDERPRPMRMVPIHMYSHAVCIENLTGNLGLGIGRIEADFNQAANTLLNQSIDADTLANCGGWLAHSSVEMSEPFEMAPGKFHYVDGIEPGELQNNIMPMASPRANPGLLEGVRMFHEWGQSAMQSPAVLSGEAGKSGETARGLTARIEQATKQTSVSANIYGAFLNQQFKHNARLNSIFLPEEEVFEVNNHMGGRELKRVGRKLYQRNYRVELMSNLRFTTEEARKANATELLNVATTHPFLANNTAVQYAALVDWFKANDQEEMIPKLGKPPPPPEQFLPPPPPLPEGTPGQ